MSCQRTHSKPIQTKEQDRARKGRSLIENTGNKGMSQDNMSIDMTWNRHVVMLLEVWSGRKYEKAKTQYELMSRSLLNSRSHLRADSESWAIC